MTLDEMKAIGQRADAIEAAKERLKKAQSKMRLLDEHGKRGTQWTVTLRLKKHSAYRYDDEITIQVVVPFEVVQQSVSYECQAARREIIQLGGTP